MINPKERSDRNKSFKALFAASEVQCVMLRSAPASRGTEITRGWVGPLLEGFPKEVVHSLSILAEKGNMFDRFHK